MWRGLGRDLELRQSLRSETTSPLAIRSPRASAASNSASCAAGKWEPNTSAVVVPLAASARTKRRRRGRRVGRVGHPRLLRQRPPASQSSSCRPIAPITAICGSGRACRRSPGAARSRAGRRSSASGYSRGRRPKWPSARIVPSPRTRSRRRRTSRARPAGERVARGVGHPGAEDRHGHGGGRSVARVADRPARFECLDFAHGRHRLPSSVTDLASPRRPRPGGSRRSTRRPRTGADGDRRRAGGADCRRSSRPTRATSRRARVRALGRADGPARARRARACARSPTARGRSRRCPIRSARSWTAGAWPNGLDFRKVRVPLGVVAVVYEARPNVTIDAAALCLKSGNAVVLRGSSSAAHSNAVLAADRRARRLRARACPRARWRSWPAAAARSWPSSPSSGGRRRPDHPARRRGAEEGARARSPACP